jgi:hypothetical protein
LGFAKTVNARRIDPVKYAHLVELGTSHSAAKPYIRPAIEAASGEILNAMSAALDAALTKEAAKLNR